MYVCVCVLVVIIIADEARAIINVNVNIFARVLIARKFNVRLTRVSFLIVNSVTVALWYVCVHTNHDE